MQRIAAYCRVSTDKEEQANSLESQKKYFKDYIDRNSYWELSDIYVDEGITGTSTKKRNAFNRMIADAQSHKFDMIITKEISRFARNTLDSIYYTRKLKELGIGVLFVNDNINTLDADAELRLTIMSSIAQEESRKTSERVKWGQKRRMEQGVVFGRNMLGYDIQDGKMHVNEAGAEIIQTIFQKFVNEGKGCFVIARELREAGIKTSQGNTEWANTMILKILRNEKYAGDLIQKKTYTPSYLNHEKKYNHGQEDFVSIINHHEPIISREMFEKAQLELKRRSPNEEQKARHTNRYCFSGKIKCGFCGKTFVPKTKRRKDGSIYKAWRCGEAASHGSPHTDKAGNHIGCDGRQISDGDFIFIMSQIVKNLSIEKEAVIDNLTCIIKTVIGLNNEDAATDKLYNKMKKIEDKKQGLLELYLGKEIAKVDFHKMNDKLKNDIALIKKEIETKSKQAELLKSQDDIIVDINATIKGLTYGEMQDLSFYRNLLDKIVVYERNTFDIYLKLLPKKLSCLIVEAPFPNSPNISGGNGGRFASSVPISFSVAFAWGVTMENRWLRYLTAAPNSPSGPPYCVMIHFAMAGLGFLILIGYSSFFSYIHIINYHLLPNKN
jgi:DNA invertase Pin-like site-specific DNA recombinase